MMSAGTPDNTRTTRFEWCSAARNVVGRHGEIGGYRRACGLKRRGTSAKKTKGELKMQFPTNTNSPRETTEEIFACQVKKHIPDIAQHQSGVVCTDNLWIRQEEPRRNLQSAV